jgi:hypothetical protein
MTASGWRWIFDAVDQEIGESWNRGKLRISDF